MKHLLCLAAALAATLALSVTAKAVSYAATTIPDSSGYVTCTGTNSDGSAATWTVGGFISYIHIYSTHSYDSHGNSLGWYSVINDSNNPSSTYADYQVTTSSNIKPGCANISGSADLWFNSYPGNQGYQNVSIYLITNPVANRPYTASSPPPDFTNITDVKDVQYKVTSMQSGQTPVTAATPYL